MSSNYFDNLLRAAAEYDASDLHLVAGVPPAYRVNGEIILADSPPITETELDDLTRALMNEHQKRKFEQDWESCISFRHPEAGRMHLTFYRRNSNPELSVRFCGREIPSREELGLSTQIDDLARKPIGLVLITGPTGSGKTTTMNYMVNLINAERRC